MEPHVAWFGASCLPLIQARQISTRCGSTPPHGDQEPVTPCSMRLSHGQKGRGLAASAWALPMPTARQCDCIRAMAFTRPEKHGRCATVLYSRRRHWSWSSAPSSHTVIGSTASASPCSHTTNLSSNSRFRQGFSPPQSRRLHHSQPIDFMPRPSPHFNNAWGKNSCARHYRHRPG